MIVGEYPMPYANMPGVDMNMGGGFFQQQTDFNQFGANNAFNGQFGMMGTGGMGVGMGMDMGMGMGMGCTTGCGMQPALTCGDNYCYDNKCNDCCEPCEETVGINKNYIFPLGLLRLAIIGVLIGGVIAAWCIPLDVGNFYNLNGAYSSTREAYIVIVSASIGVAFIIFFLSVTNLVNIPSLQSPFWIIFFCLLDVLSIVSLIGVGVAASVREAQIYYWQPADFFDTVRQGSFAAAGALALFAVLLYAGSILLSVPYIINLFKDQEENC